MEIRDNWNEWTPTISRVLSYMRHFTSTCPGPGDGTGIVSLTSFGDWPSGVRTTWDELYWVVIIQFAGLMNVYNVRLSLVGTISYLNQYTCWSARRTEGEHGWNTPARALTLWWIIPQKHFDLYIQVEAPLRPGHESILKLLEVEGQPHRFITSGTVLIPRRCLNASFWHYRSC